MCENHSPLLILIKIKLKYYSFLRVHLRNKDAISFFFLIQVATTGVK